MKHKKTRRSKPRQYGGMKFGSEFKKLLMKKISQSSSSSSGVAAAANTLDKLIIQTLFENATDFDILSDKSRYSIVFRVGIPDNFLLDTTQLSLENAVDKPDNDDEGDVKLSFCVKLTYIHDTHERVHFNYRTTEEGAVNKSSMTLSEHHNEVQSQKDVYDSLNCRNPSVVFVPDILASSVFTMMELTDLLTDLLTKFNINILNLLQLPSLPTPLKFGMTVMEFFENGKEAYDVTLVKYRPYISDFTASQQIIIALKLKMLLYDCHKANVMASEVEDPYTKQMTIDQIKMIDFGGTCSLYTPAGITLLQNSFGFLLDQALKKTPGHPTIEELCHFFSCSEEEISFKFISALEKLLKYVIDHMSFDSDDATNFCHETLMTIAFIDLLINNYKYSVKNVKDDKDVYTFPTPNIFQIGDTIKDIYGGFNEVAFKTFSGFVRNFIHDASIMKEKNPNYTIYCSLHRVVDDITNIRTSCIGTQKNPYELSIMNWLETQQTGLSTSIVKNKKDQIAAVVRTKAINRDHAIRMFNSWKDKVVEEVRAAKEILVAEKARAAEEELRVKKARATEKAHAGKDLKNTGGITKQPTQPKKPNDCKKKGGIGCVMMGGTRKNIKRKKNHSKNSRRYKRKK
jgi:hypothetical protein